MNSISVDGPPSAPDGEQKVPVAYEYSSNLPAILREVGGSLLVSTYQAGKLFSIGVANGQLRIQSYNFDQAMGIAVGSRQIAVGTRREIWYLKSARIVAAPTVRPQPDAHFLTRTAHYTGMVHGHELVYSGDELWQVNTLFSCLSTIDSEYSFVPRWRPPFITTLAAEDRCHLNGLAMENDRPKYVTALGETDQAAGWRPDKSTGGVIIDVTSNAVVSRNLAMPHSPRLDSNGRLWVLNSGFAQLSHVDRHTGRVEPICELPGYTRGLAITGPYAWVGLSKIRETSVFGGLPIESRRNQLQCGFNIVDLRMGRTVGGLLFHSAVAEIFAVEFLPGFMNPTLSGPLPDRDDQAAIWYAPHDASSSIS